MYKFEYDKHYKIYLHNDVELLEKLVKQYRNAADIKKFFIQGFNITGTYKCPLYIRIRHCIFVGKNSTGDCNFFDRDDMITIDGRDLVSAIPDELFQM